MKNETFMYNPRCEIHRFGHINVSFSMARNILVVPDEGSEVEWSRELLCRP